MIHCFGSTMSTLIIWDASLLFFLSIPRLKMLMSMYMNVLLPTNLPCSQKAIIPWVIVGDINFLKLTVCIWHPMFVPSVHIVCLHTYNQALARSSLRWEIIWQYMKVHLDSRIEENRRMCVGLLNTYSCWLALYLCLFAALEQVCSVKCIFKGTQF